MTEMMMAVRKARLEPGFVLEKIPIPKIAPDEVLVSIEAASVCGTDLSIWKWKGWSSKRIRPPLTVGHEMAGRVVEVGKEVRDVFVDDYVSAESHVTCGVCKACRTGQAHTCAGTGSHPTPGSSPTSAGPATQLIFLDRYRLWRQGNDWKPYTMIPST